MKRNLLRISMTILSTMVILASGLPASQAALPLVPDDTWGANGQVNAILRVGGSIYLGGEFTALESDGGTSVARNHLAAIDAFTGQPTSFNPNVSNSVFGLAVSPDESRLYAAGSFQKVSGQTRKMIVAFNLPSGSLSTWKPVAWPNSSARAVAVTNDRVYIGGSFITVGTVARAKLAAFSPVDGSLSSSWVPRADGLVRDVEVADGRVYLSGNFVNINGSAQRAFAGVDLVSGANACATCYHPGYPVLDIEAGPTRVYLAGGGGGGKAVAVSSSTGAKLWEKRTDGNVQAVSILAGTPYFGGHFFKYGTAPVGWLVRVDRVTGALDTSWVPIVANGFLGIFAVHGFNANLYIGGDFTRVSDVKQVNFAQWTDDAIAASVDVSVDLSDAPDPVDVGSQLTYTAQVANAGPDAAVDVMLTDPLSPDVSFLSASPACSYDGGTHTVSCALGTMIPGASASPVIRVTPGTAGAIGNTASVSSLGSDSVTSNDTSTVTTTVNAVPGADLNLLVNPSQGVLVDQGDPFDYLLTVTNDGPDPDPSVTITDALPAEVTPNGNAFTSEEGTCTGTTTVTCDLGEMAPGDIATVTIPVFAPAEPRTIVNTASVDGTANDVDTSDNSVVRTNAVRDPAKEGDATAPSMTSMVMRDDDADGLVDNVVVTFNEPLGACSLPCTTGWNVTNVPSAGALQSVTVSGNQATLHIDNHQNLADTAVGLFKVQLASQNHLQDLNGNRPSFAATAPADGAGPVAVGFRKGHSTSDTGCVTGTNGVAEPCDELSAEWSEALLASSIPATVTVTITDPAGSGNDRLFVNNFIQGSMDLGADTYVTLDDSSASWTASKLLLQGGAAQDTVTVRIFGSCTGGGCGSLGVSGDVTVVYNPSPLIKDLAGNGAAGSFTKLQKMF